MGILSGITSPPSSSSDCSYSLVSYSDFVASVTSPSSTSVTWPNSDWGSFILLLVGISCSTCFLLSSTVFSTSSLNQDASLSVLLFFVKLAPLAILLYCSKSPIFAIFSTSVHFSCLSRLSSTPFSDTTTSFPLSVKMVIVFWDSDTILNFLSETTSQVSTLSSFLG